MRLSPEEIAGIRAAADEVFGPQAVVRLFGSRVDDSRKGGDIDLLVEVPPGRESFNDECAFARALEDKIGERRVDVALFDPARLRESGGDAYEFQKRVLPGSLPLEADPALVEEARRRRWRPCLEARWPMRVTVADIRKTVAAMRRVADRLRFSMGRDMPETVEALEAASPEDAERIDAFLKRWEQLEDMLERRLARQILTWLDDEPIRIPVRDQFDRLEKIGAIASAGALMGMRGLRNELTHEYPGDAETRLRRLTAARVAAPALLEDFNLLAAFAATLTDEGETS
jgi:predicted nucleotidyltransferase